MKPTRFYFDASGSTRTRAKEQSLAGKGVNMLKLNNLKVVGLVGVLAIMLAACSTGQKQNTSSGQNPTQKPINPTSNATDEAKSLVIVYSDSGFAPASVNAKVGQEVVFINSGSKAVQVNSAPHPAHTLFQELNVGMINVGESKSLTFTTTGTKKYHNHLNASENGSIIVE